ncbi:MAG: helix-turn-helix transcriptional regulator [Firmicutes bacterium]|nr:helix-turn-helix transcriptional regulator [Candidatus Colivicinus equi]
MDSTDVKFGEIIKRRRRELKLTQEELGKKVGCSKVCVHYYEKGLRGLTLSQFFKFCTVLGLDPDYVQKELK